MKSRSTIHDPIHRHKSPRQTNTRCAAALSLVHPPGMICVAALALSTLLTTSSAAPVKPKTHVLAILADGTQPRMCPESFFAQLTRRCVGSDFGWFDSGWHAESGDGDDEVARTPVMDKLVQSGMELDRNYAVRASPTAAAHTRKTQTGETVWLGCGSAFLGLRFFFCCSAPCL